MNQKQVDEVTAILRPVIDESKRATLMAHALGALIARDDEYRRIRSEIVEEARWYADMAMAELNPKALCGKVCSGVACTMKKGTGCPDCTVSLHDVGAPE